MLPLRSHFHQICEFKPTVGNFFSLTKDNPKIDEKNTHVNHK